MFLNTADFRRAALAFVAILAFVLVGCSQAESSQALSSDPVVGWIQQNAIALRTVKSGGSDADLAPLQTLVGQASIVGLGEETHGTHEIIEVKARLAEYLITHLGFTTFVMENDWGHSQLIDAYINGGPGTIEAVMQANLYSAWQTQEFRALLEWMRAYNADPAHGAKVHFLGMDILGDTQSEFDAVEQYVQQAAPQEAAQVQALYAPIISSSLPNLQATYIPLNASTKAQYQTQAQQVYDLLAAHKQQDIQHSSPERFALALQNARIIVQFTIYYDFATQGEADARYFQRDTFMAENVAWIHDHDAGSAPKIIVWAHDGHIANDVTYDSQDGLNMGGELRAQFQSSYLAIGTTLYQGSFRIYTPSGTSIEPISGAVPGTSNYTLGQAGLPLFLLDLRHIPPGPAADWASGPDAVLNYGIGGEDLTGPGPLSQWFDMIVHIQKSAPSTPL